MVDIGSLGGSNEFCNTCFQTVHGGLNNNGQIAGISATKDGSFHAFLYSGGKMTDLGPWYPASINDRGTVVGTYVDPMSYAHPVIWHPGDTSPMELPTFGGTGAVVPTLLNSETFFNRAAAINNSGEVTGGSMTTLPEKTGYCSPGACHAFLYKDSVPGRLKDLGTLRGGESSGTAINNTGVAAGISFSTQKVPKKYKSVWGPYVSWAVLFNKGKVIKEPMPAYVGDIWALNDHGDGAGYVTTKTNDSSSDPNCGYTPNAPIFIGAMWMKGKLTKLEPVGGYADGKGTGINNDGTVVGESGYQCTYGLATIWRNGKGADLNKLVSNKSTFVLRYAQAINNSGQIAALGWDPQTGQGDTFLLTPCSGAACKTFKGNASKTSVVKSGDKRNAGALIDVPWNTAS